MFDFCTNLIRLLCCAGLALLFCCTASVKSVQLGQLPQFEAVQLEDEQFGHEVLSELSKEYALTYDDSRFSAAVESMNHLLEAAGADEQAWHLYVFDAPQEARAQAAHGNHIFLWSGVFELVDSRDQLAAIIAPQIGHLLAGHTKNMVPTDFESTMGTVGGVTFATTLAYFTAGAVWVVGPENFGEWFVEIFKSKPQKYRFSKAEHVQAEEIGLTLLQRSPYIPEARLQFWKKLSRDMDMAEKAEALVGDWPLEERIEFTEQALEILRSKGGISPSDHGSFQWESEHDS